MSENDLIVGMALDKIKNNLKRIREIDERLAEIELEEKEREKILKQEKRGEDLEIQHIKEDDP